MVFFEVLRFVRRKQERIVFDGGKSEICQKIVVFVSSDDTKAKNVGPRSELLIAASAGEFEDSRV